MKLGRVAVFTFVALAACGRKAPVKPPELARPAVIEDLEASNQAEAVVLSWSRPGRYADGTRMADLGSFQLERARGVSGDFEAIALLPVTDRERFRQIKRFRFADRGAEVGEGYRYRVVSSTVDGYVSAPSNIVAIVREEVAAPVPTPTAAPEERERR